jgi:hypothetical protein
LPLFQKTRKSACDAHFQFATAFNALATAKIRLATPTIRVATGHKRPATTLIRVATPAKALATALRPVATAIIPVATAKTRFFMGFGHFEVVKKRQLTPFRGSQPVCPQATVPTKSACIGGGRA